jgi:2-polyprenyl-6-methoxyphenol hydroxylase-like FAD-dependent oxidoreductase
VARGGRLSPSTDVLVVGAGPTGLTTALQAHEHGARVRVVDRRAEAARPSRAMIVHPRTLEVLRPLGVTEALLARADRAPAAELHLGRRQVPVQLGDVALPDTPFPHLTMVRQMDVETVLAEALQARGVEVERGVELVHASTGATAARATLNGHRPVEEVTCGFLVGCDGPDSAVRRSAAIGWQGAPYREEVVLADVELAGELEPGRLHVVAARPGLVFLFALGEGATWRLLATRPGRGTRTPFGQPGPEVPAREVQQILDAAGLEAALVELRWSARVRLQHRLADSFRAGRLFLAGDAAHTHSPAAAQGMNTGIVDAVNLGWKLAFAGTGEHEILLGSYELERRPVARQVLALTHLVFFAEASTHPLPALLRGTVLPLTAPVVPLLLRQPHLMGLAVRLLSQGWVHYRRSPLSVGATPTARGPRPGDRLPDQEVTAHGRRTRLHDLTAGPGVHVLLDRDAALPAQRPLGPRVTVHRVTSWPGRGLRAVRPDGHVGFADDDVDAGRLADWLDLVAAPRG